ncbi:uncharacterized protein SCODWIG_03736 [Saccharomycodes ludwigii]|uniref:EH domain-containing protein n=1 Tax=Saccharomycodes ludwigii TaxID=36035 RepID=A0A376BBA8_9ASCO|nr:uncharacterized protein SCODWIG_03736 [Saccharomycodes ludwigii]
MLKHSFLKKKFKSLSSSLGFKNNGNSNKKANNTTNKNTITKDLNHTRDPTKNTKEKVFLKNISSPKSDETNFNGPMSIEKPQDAKKTIKSQDTANNGKAKLSSTSLLKSANDIGCQSKIAHKTASINQNVVATGSDGKSTPINTIKNKKNIEFKASTPPNLIKNEQEVSNSNNIVNRTTENDFLFNESNIKPSNHRVDLPKKTISQDTIITNQSNPCGNIEALASADSFKNIGKLKGSSTPRNSISREHAQHHVLTTMRNNDDINDKKNISRIMNKNSQYKHHRSKSSLYSIASSVIPHKSTSSFVNVNELKTNEANYNINGTGITAAVAKNARKKLKSDLLYDKNDKNLGTTLHSSLSRLSTSSCSSLPSSLATSPISSDLYGFDNFPTPRRSVSSSTANNVRSLLNPMKIKGKRLSMDSLVSSIRPSITQNLSSNNLHSFSSYDSSDDSVGFTDRNTKYDDDFHFYNDGADTGAGVDYDDGTEDDDSALSSTSSSINLPPSDVDGSTNKKRRNNKKQIKKDYNKKRNSCLNLQNKNLTNGSFPIGYSHNSSKNKNNNGSGLNNDAHGATNSSISSLYKSNGSLSIAGHNHNTNIKNNNNGDYLVTNKTFNEDKPWKHHLDLGYITASERQRYEGIWISNKNKYLNLLPWEGVSEHAAKKDAILNLIVLEIWNRSKLSQRLLYRIYNMVDLNKDGTLSRKSFIVGMWLIDQCLYGKKLPNKVADKVWQSVDHIIIEKSGNKSKNKATINSGTSHRKKHHGESSKLYHSSKKLVKESGSKVKKHLKKNLI